MGKAHLPVAESFGFTGALRQATSREGAPWCFGTLIGGSLRSGTGDHTRTTPVPGLFLEHPTFRNTRQGRTASFLSRGEPSSRHASTGLESTRAIPYVALL